MMLYQATVKGELASKSNSRRIVRNGRYPRSIKSAKALAWVEGFELQVPTPKKPFTEDIALFAWVYYASRRPDLDVALLMDAIERAGIIQNDRQVRHINAYGLIDRKDPRVYFQLHSISKEKKTLAQILPAVLF